MPALVASVLALALACAPVAPPVPATGQLDAREHRSHKRMAIAGAVVFTVFYAAGTAVAATELDWTANAEDTPENRDRRRIAHLMFVPVFGPFVASPLGRTRSDKAGLAGFGILQGFGLAMLGFAGHRLVRHRAAVRDHRLSLTGGVGRTGGFIGLRGSF